MSSGKPVMLLIMDGFGIAEEGPGNAVAAARTPNLDRFFETCASAKLEASGRAVGLPAGQMGNSEVGHENIGAGRIVWQELSLISNAIEDGSFFEVAEFRDAMRRAAESGKALHIMGLLSDGGVHSHNTHLYALLGMARDLGVKNVYVHCILDGRDVPPVSAEGYIKELEDRISEIGCGKIATVSGRFFAMDRDQHWDRIEKAYDLYVLGEGREARDALALLEEARRNGEHDEFVCPGKVSGTPVIDDGDSVIFFNFRPDRARQIARCMTEPDFDGFERRRVPKDIFYVCMTPYDSSLDHVSVAFKLEHLKNTMGEYVSGLGLRQLRIAETEKYAHVTFFFDDGAEEPYPGEERILVHSPNVETYDLMPEMSAREITGKVLEKLEADPPDLIVMNLANCDMVGHTGVFDAAVSAVETVDECVGKIASEIVKIGGKLVITADHGNAEKMSDENGEIVTSHTTNKVPVILVGDGRKLRDGSLCDLAPTLLELMEVPIPPEMTGKSLLC